MDNKKLKIAYAGAPGAYAEVAAKQIFVGCDALPQTDFAAAYNAAADGCDAAVLPLENSYAGDIAHVIDLAFSGSLNITGIYEMEISHCLLGVRGARLSDITDVVSHQQALWQSAGFISRHGMTPHESSNTAVAAENAAREGKKNVGVIAGKYAAEIYGLEILAENISESVTNTTRFAVFSKDKPVGREHFIIFFTVKNEAGSLSRAVSVISKYGFNLRALKSRPTKECNWEYYFYVEGDGDINGGAGRDMVKELTALCLNIKVAGTY